MRELNWKKSSIEGVLQEAWAPNGSYRIAKTWVGMYELYCGVQSLGLYLCMSSAKKAALVHKKEKNNV